MAGGCDTCAGCVGKGVMIVNYAGGLAASSGEDGLPKSGIDDGRSSSCIGDGSSAASYVAAWYAAKCSSSSACEVEGKSGGTGW